MLAWLLKPAEAAAETTLADVPVKPKVVETVPPKLEAIPPKPSVIKLNAASRAVNDREVHVH